jgi:Protein of unknown function DUF262
MPFAKPETVMWEKPPPPRPDRTSDAEINARYETREGKIVVEMNREKLPNFVEALKRPNYMNVRPFYQRRLRWDQILQSRFIESFIINIPVPPLFLYETSYNSYEVIDGQQRITAVRAFYENDLVLKGLEHWPELNGRKYRTLPSNIRAGIDRRSISYFVVLTESAQSAEEALLLKQIVFKRLNTGGVRLSNQEIRNSLYHGDFNRMLFKLAAHPLFRQAWLLPPPTHDEEERPSPDLLKSETYKKMDDVEAVLRFFALRHHDRYQRGMQGFLDLYMIRSRDFTEEGREFLKRLFERTIELAHGIYGKLLFRPFVENKNSWSRRPQKAFADAVMVGISNHLEHATTLLERKDRIIQATRDLFLSHPTGTFTGRRNTKQDVQERITLFSAMLSEVCSE